jgi:hypothetical protein
MNAATNNGLLATMHAFDVIYERADVKPFIEREQLKKIKAKYDPDDLFSTNLTPKPWTNAAQQCRRRERTRGFIKPVRCPTRSPNLFVHGQKNSTHIQGGVGLWCSR